MMVQPASWSSQLHAPASFMVQPASCSSGQPAAWSSQLHGVSPGWPWAACHSAVLKTRMVQATALGAVRETSHRVQVPTASQTPLPRHQHLELGHDSDRVQQRGLARLRLPRAHHAEHMTLANGAGNRRQLGLAEGPLEVDGVRASEGVKAPLHRESLRGA